MCYSKAGLFFSMKVKRGIMHWRKMSQSVVTSQLEDLRRYRIVIIDESHNFRNKDGQRYQAIKSYLEKNESKVILLTATPFDPWDLSKETP